MKNATAYFKQNFQECASTSAASSSTPNLSSMCVAAAVANPVVGVVLAEESDSDLGQNQPSTSNSRARQKKFLKTFKHLPQEELVLQRKTF